MTNDEVSRNMRSVRHAIAQQELEGLTVPAAVVEDMERAARGEIEPSEGIRNLYRQFPNVEIFKP